MEKSFDVVKKQQYGKILDFDGEDGTIVYNDGLISFNKGDIYNFDNQDNILKKGDIVSFKINKSIFGGEIENIAKFINIEEKEDIKSIKK